MAQERDILDCFANSNIGDVYKNSDQFNILSRNGTFTIAKDLGYLPVWATSFKERGVRDGKTIILTSDNYNHENLFIDWQIPRQWKHMRIENEVVLDNFKDRAFVQRVYWIDRDGREILTEVSTAVCREEVTDTHGNLHVNSQWIDPESKVNDKLLLSGLVITNVTPQDLLETHFPFSTVHR